MRITSAEFARCAVKPADFPSDGLPEIALIGRSNVGKSSLINKLVNRKGLAKTSSTPGKTQTINFYRVNGSFYIVDLPGFGYAKVPLSVKRSWKKMMGDYMEGRSALKGAAVILDPRRDPGDVETSLYAWLEEMGLPVLTVLTKSDKLSRNALSSRLAAIKRELPVRAHLHFSALTGDGRLELGKAIDLMLKGPGTSGD